MADGENSTSKTVGRTYGPRPQYPIESVDNALKVLLLLGEQRTIRLTDISAYLGVATSTAHRVLAMLQYRGFIQQAGKSKLYEPGPALSSLAVGALRQIDIRERLHGHLERLSSALGETVHLGRLDGTSVTFIDSVEGPRAVRVASRLGRSMPAHCTSTGKALLATMDDDEIRARLGDAELPKLTPRSVGSLRDLLKVVTAVRSTGFATSSEESEEGVASVAMALGTSQPARYALNVSMPVTRMNKTVRANVIAQLNAIRADVDSMLIV